jgi:hypothetical protein
VSGLVPVHNPMAAALAAAEAHVPVVQPVRSPDVRSATPGDISGSIGLSGVVPVMVLSIVLAGPPPPLTVALDRNSYG